MIISLHEHEQAITSEFYEEYEKYSFAILSERNRNEPAFVGSGFCIEFRNNWYLITASHVLQDLREGLGFYIGKRDLIELKAAGLRTIAEGPDHFDIATIPIKSEQLSEIGICPISERMISKSVDFPSGYHCLIGFPRSKNKLGKAVNVGAKKIESRCYSIVTTRAEAEYSTFGKTENYHIALNYKFARNKKGKVTSPPSLQGVSGSPLWTTKDKYSVKNALLSGLLIEYHDSEKVALCTRTNAVIEFINARYA